MPEIKEIIDAKPILDEKGEVDLQLSYMKANQMHADFISSIYQLAKCQIKDLISAVIKFISCPRCLFAN